MGNPNAGLPISYIGIFIFYQYPNFLRFNTRKRSVTATAINSAATIEYHIPSRPKNSGKIITAALWNKSVLRNDISAEVRPSFKAVKNAEPNMAVPAKIKEKA